MLWVPGGHGEKEARFPADIIQAQRRRSPLSHRTRRVLKGDREHIHNTIVGEHYQDVVTAVTKTSRPLIALPNGVAREEFEQSAKAALIQNWKPWEYSTGPRTAGGKATSAWLALQLPCTSSTGTR
jgi:hypothetical protein